MLIAELRLWYKVHRPVCWMFSQGHKHRPQGFSGGVTFLVSSVLVTVPSDDLVTVFSLDLTVPSLLTVLVLSLETWRSHPTTINDNAKADTAARVTMLLFFIGGKIRDPLEMAMG